MHLPKLGQKIRELTRLATILGDPTVSIKPTKANDTLLICPWLCLNRDVDVDFNKINGNFEKGRLVIPIRCDDKASKIHCFFPCDGLDDNQNYLFGQNHSQDFGLNIPPYAYNEEKCVGTISIDKKELDHAQILKDQLISDGDILRVRSEHYTVLGWSFDSFNRNFKSVRFTKNVTKNAKFATYYKVIKPSIKGNFAWIDKCCLENYRGVNFIFSKCENLHGQLSITFQNACFNSLIKSYEQKNKNAIFKKWEKT